MDGESSNFITPPPGLFPNAPAAEPAPTVTQSGTHNYVRPEGTPRPAVQPPAFFPAPLGAQPRAVSLTLQSEDGANHVITGQAVIGRNPSATGEWAGSIIIVVDDPEKSVSKTHAAVRVTPGGSTVVDLHSTNGTGLVRLDGTEMTLTPGVPVAVKPGEVIIVGSRAVRVVA